MDVVSPAPSIRFPDQSGRALTDVVREAPCGAVVELAPGRYSGPLTIDRPITLKGAGDLTRLAADHVGPVVSIDVEDSGLVFLESLALEFGRNPQSGGGIAIHRGRVRIFNVFIRDCQAEGAGGGLWVGGGDVQATLVRISGTRAPRGGSVALQGASRLVMTDAQCREASAEVGGGLHVQDCAELRLSGVTFGDTRASAPAGGQVVWLGEATGRGPDLRFEKVRFEDAPLGKPLVVQPDRPGRVVLFECDVPSDVLDNPGIVDGGNNRWR